MRSAAATLPGVFRNPRLRLTRIESYVASRTLWAVAGALGIIAALIFLIDFVDVSRNVGVRAEVRELCATLGSEVRVMLPDERTLEGRATGLDDAGRLIVAVGGESVPVAAGDVIHVR